MAGRRITYAETVTTTNAVTSTTSTPFFVGRSKIISVQAIIDVNTPGAKSFAEADVNVTDDVITEAAHGYTTGLKGQFTTTTTLPSGLSLATDYFIIAVTSGTYAVATSLALALAGTKVDLVDDGTGTHTFTPTALAGGLVGLEKSNNYDPEQNPTGDWSFDSAAFTADGTSWVEKVDPGYEWARLKFDLTAGSISAVSYIVVKEDL